MPHIFSLSPCQLDQFDCRGVLRLPGFYPQAAISLMADKLWADLETRYGISHDQPEKWTVASPAEFSALKRSGAFDALGLLELFALADTLLGVDVWGKPKHWGFPLVSFPTPIPTLRRPPWHLDISGSEQLHPLPILRVFTMLEPVRPSGGGTLYVAGSHRLAMDIERAEGAPVRSAQVRDRLKAEYPWFSGLLATDSRDLREWINVEASAGSHIVRLEEMTGAPGDLIVMHPAVLHAAAHNALDRPRMMLTEWIARRGDASG